MEKKEDGGSRGSPRRTRRTEDRSPVAQLLGHVLRLPKPLPSPPFSSPADGNVKDAERPLLHSQPASQSAGGCHLPRRRRRRQDCKAAAAGGGGGGLCSLSCPSSLFFFFYIFSIDHARVRMASDLASPFPTLEEDEAAESPPPAPLPVSVWSYPLLSARGILPSSATTLTPAKSGPRRGKRK